MTLAKEDFFPERLWNAESVPPKGVVLTIKHVEEERLGIDRELRAVLYFEEDHRGLPLSKTRWLSLESFAGGNPARWVGQKVFLRTAQISFKGKAVPSIHISRPPPTPEPAPQEKPDVE